MNREAYTRLARLWATTLACINCGQMTKANSNAQALVDALRAALVALVDIAAKREADGVMVDYAEIRAVAEARAALGVRP